jgi:hypothetical protein
LQEVTVLLVSRLKGVYSFYGSLFASGGQQVVRDFLDELCVLSHHPGELLGSLHKRVVPLTVSALEFEQRRRKELEGFHLVVDSAVAVLVLAVAQ